MDIKVNRAEDEHAVRGNDNRYQVHAIISQLQRITLVRATYYFHFLLGIRKLIQQYQKSILATFWHFIWLIF